MGIKFLKKFLRMVGVILFLFFLRIFVGFAQEDEGLLGDYRWDYREEELSWSDWVEQYINWEEAEETLEEMAPLLLRLERWYQLPRNINTLTAGDLNTFFWLSAGEKKKILDYRKKKDFIEIEELDRENIVSPENYYRMLPFITVKKRPSFSEEQTEISYGIALRAKEIHSFEDFSEVMKNYQIKWFGEIHKPNIFDFHFLAERDPNEIKIWDLEKWSFMIHLPLSQRDSSGFGDRATLIGGALKVNIHQSLLMATGYPLRKNEQSPHSVKRNFSQIQGDKSAQEIFLHGFAIDFHLKTWRLGIWSGQIRYDDTIYTNESDPSKLYAKGYSLYPSLHRPFPILSLRENLLGFLVEKRIDYHVLSMAFLYSQFSHPIFTSNPDSFFGKSHWGISWGWDLDFNLYHWYGEGVLLFNEKRKNPWERGSRSFRASSSWVTGARIFFPRSDLFLSFRFIPQSYQAVHNLSYSRYSVNDEVGILGGYRLNPLPSLKLVSSFDFFKRIEGYPLQFGIDLSQLLNYRHRSGYYQESQIRLRERGEWEDDYNHFWELKHRSGWKDSSWLFYGEMKLSGNLITEMIKESPHPFGLLLTFHGEYRYRDISITVMEGIWSLEGPRILYDLIYHNRFFNDLLSLNRDAFLLFLRQEFRFHSFFHTGFSLGFYWDNSKGALFQSKNPNRALFSFYINGKL